jgi:hypothetical protein
VPYFTFLWFRGKPFRVPKSAGPLRTEGFFVSENPPPVIGLNYHRQTATEGGRETMNEGVAIVIAAVLGSGLSLFISELFRCIHIRAEQRERFFYELYPRRLELYEEIIKEIYPVDAFEKMLVENYRDNNIEAIVYAAKEKAERLNRLAHRNVLLGHSDITLLLRDLVEFCEAVAGRRPIPVNTSGDTFSFPAPGFTHLSKRIMEFIREESGKYVVNKKIFRYFKEFEADQRKEEKKKHSRRKGPEYHPYDRDSY